jgi:hypothetical protein
MWWHTVTYGRGSEGETGEWSGYPVPFTLPRNMVYPGLLPLMRTPRLPVVDWTDAPADVNGLVRCAERRNLVSVPVPSHFNWPLLAAHPMTWCQTPGFAACLRPSYNSLADLAVRLVVGLLLQRLMGFVVEIVTMEHVCLRVLQLSSVNLIPQTTLSHSLLYHRSQTP